MRKSLVGRRVRGVGLKNLGNTCYLNAVLQSLASSSSLHMFLAENQKYLLTRQPLTEALRDTITEMSTNNGKTIKPPDSIFAVKRLSHMLGSKGQEDAHELMQEIMTILDEEHGNSFTPSLHSLKKPIFNPLLTSIQPVGVLQSHPIRPFIPMLFSTRTQIRSYSTLAQPHPKNPFYGLLANTMKCNGCGRESSPHYQKFFGLSLPMPDCNEMQTSKEVSIPLEKCLDLFAGQMVEGVAWDHVPPEIEKVIVPTTTTTHLRAGDGMFMRNQTTDPALPFDIPADLAKPLQHIELTSARLPSFASLSAECCTSTGTCTAFLNCNIAKPPKSLCLHLRRLIALAGGNVKLETHVKFPLYLDLSAYCKTGLGEEDRVVEYILTSVIVHNGDVNGGHFTCYRRQLLPELQNKEEYKECIEKARAAGTMSYDEDSAWFDISDDKLEFVAQERVLECNAYMLYYEQQRNGAKRDRNSDEKSINLRVQHRSSFDMMDKQPQRH